MLTNREEEKWHYHTPGIPDEYFIRGSVPMTKEEVRILTIAKTRFKGNEIVYDIGAGTGSISLEAARLVPQGKVYAIEQNPEGVELIKANAQKLGIDNIEVIHGRAPQALSGLPSPQRVIIGGSSGSMEEIFLAFLPLLPKDGRVVINAITVESIHQGTELAEKYLKEVEIVQINIAKGEKLGKYHLMKAHNPVFIISGVKADKAIGGEGDDR